MNFSISAIEWKHWESLWFDTNIQLQLLIILILVSTVFVLTKITKPVVENLSESSQLNDFSKSIWSNLTRMIAPIYLLIACMLSIVLKKILYFIK